MKFDKFIKDWKSLLAENFFLKVTTILFGIGLIMNATFFKKNEVIIVTPPEVKTEYWVTNNQASEAYIEQMSIFFATLAGNLSPSSAAYSVNALLSYVTPNLHGDIKEALTGEAVSIIENNITQSFYPSDISVDGNKATVKGLTVRRLGSTNPVSEQVVYEMGFIIKNYRVYINELYIDYPDKIRRALFEKKKGIVGREEIKQQVENAAKEIIK